MKKIWNFVKNYYGVIIFCTLIGVGIGHATNAVLEEIDAKSKTDYQYHIHQDRMELAYQGAKDVLVQEVDKYIQTVAPGSCLNGITLVDACLEYDVDIKFALVQGHCESHFGTKGIASKTNSVFNVCAFDGLSASQIMKNGHGYSHPDHSVVPYLKLLTTKYLVDGKTEQDMFDKFVDVGGHRYASNKNYEAHLLSTYEKVDSIANITAAYKEYRRLKIIVGE